MPPTAKMARAVLKRGKRAARLVADVPRRHHDQPGSIPGPAAAAIRSLVRVDGYELNAELLDLLDEPEQVRLIGDLAGQHRHARKPLQAACLQTGIRTDRPAPREGQAGTCGLAPGFCPCTTQSHPQAGDPSSPTGWIPLGELLPGQTRPVHPVRALDQSRTTRQADLDGGAPAAPGASPGMLARGGRVRGRVGARRPARTPRACGRSPGHDCGPCCGSRTAHGRYPARTARPAEA